MAIFLMLWEFSFKLNKGKPGRIRGPEIISYVFQSVSNLYQISSACILKGIRN